MSLVYKKPIKIGKYISIVHLFVYKLENHYRYLPEVPSLDLEQLIGSGSTLNVDGNRQSAADRAIERLNEMDAQKLPQKVTEEISGV